MTKTITAPRMRALIKRHRGNLTAIAGALKPPITRQGCAWHLRRFGLLDEATQARAGAGVKGPRTMSDGAAIEVPGERAEIVAALEDTPDRAEACAMLGISRRTLYRKLHQYGLL